MGREGGGREGVREREERGEHRAGHSEHTDLLVY